MAASENNAHDSLPQKLTAEELGTWIPVKEVFRRLCAARLHSVTAATTLVTRLGNEVIRAGAATHMPQSHPRAKGGVIEIEASRWRTIEYPTQSDVWSTGDITLAAAVSGRGSLRSVSFEIAYFGIRLERVEVERMLAEMGENPPTAIPKIETSTAPGKDVGGAPKKDFWDDLWVAILGQLWSNKLTPASQADIERAMLDWAESKGKQLGETTVKRPAQKLFKAYKTWV